MPKCDSEPTNVLALLQSHVSVDDLWGDQSLEGEPGLPPGWRKIRDAAGTYYWHVPSGSTQWQRPTWEPGDAESGTVGGV